MPFVPFARQSKVSDAALGYSGERLLNWFLRPADTFAQGVLMGRSGLVEQVGSLGGRVRAAAPFGSKVVLAAGAKLWEYDQPSGVVTAVGDIPDGETIMASSGSEVAVVVGGKYYLWQGSGAVTERTTGAVDVPVAVTYQDGYFVVAGEVAGRKDGLTVSGLNDGAEFNALDFAFAESLPDDLVTILSDHGELWLFGSHSIEVWYNSGNVSFPFEPNRGANMEKGCGYALSVAKEDNSVFWIGPDDVVYRSNGMSPQVISTREIEEALKASTVEQAFTFSDRGHKFYAIRRTGASTLCYDITTGLWCERSTGIDEAPWPCTCQAMVRGVELLGTDDGRVAVQDPEVYTDFGATYRSEAVSVPLIRGGNVFAVSKIHINMSTGTVEQPETAEVALQTSQDGRTWSREKFRIIPDLGEYFRRLVWHGLGSFRRFQVRLRISEPINRDLYGVSYE